VTRTFTDEGQTRFAAFVPEDALRPGRNAVDVFAVVSGGAAPVLDELRGGDVGLVLRSRGGTETIESSQGTKIRIEPGALTGSVQVSATKAGFAFRGQADRAKPRSLVDSIAVFADGEAVFVGRASDLRPLKFLGAQGGGKDRFAFELPRGLLPRPGSGRRVRVYATLGGIASELHYSRAYPWSH
jgi:hypothetical protein